LLIWRIHIEYRAREIFVYESMSSKNAFRGIELLSFLMPKFVINRIKDFSSYGLSIADDAGVCTILFCNICDFEKICEVCGSEVVKVLDQLFRNFDSLCEKYGLQKIETQGKTYMAAGGLDFVETQIPEELEKINVTVRAINLALEMQKCAGGYKIQDGLKINLKIGIHRGECMMGIIGYHKPQFSLIGDTINTSARHSAMGKPGNVMVSVQAWQHSGITNEIPYQVADKFMKGKGTLPVYFIVSDLRSFKTILLEAIGRLENPLSSKT
jgi:class 3 adenylate cyclase